MERYSLELAAACDDATARDLRDRRIWILEKQDFLDNQHEMVYDMPVTKHGRQIQYGSLELAARRRLTDAEIWWNAELIVEERRGSASAATPATPASATYPPPATPAAATAPTPVSASAPNPATPAAATAPTPGPASAPTPAAATDRPPATPAAATAPLRERSTDSPSEETTAATKAKRASPREEGLTSKTGPPVKRMPSNGPPPPAESSKRPVPVPPWNVLFPPPPWRTEPRESALWQVRAEMDRESSQAERNRQAHHDDERARGSAKRSATATSSKEGTAERRNQRNQADVPARRQSNAVLHGADADEVMK